MKWPAILQAVPGSPLERAPTGVRLIALIPSWLDWSHSATAQSSGEAGWLHATEQARNIWFTITDSFAHVCLFDLKIYTCQGARYVSCAPFSICWASQSSPQCNTSHWRIDLIEGKNKAIDTLRLQKSSNWFLLTTGNKAIYGNMVESSFISKLLNPPWHLKSLFIRQTQWACWVPKISAPGSF